MIVFSKIASNQKVVSVAGPHQKMTSEIVYIQTWKKRAYFVVWIKWNISGYWCNYYTLVFSSYLDGVSSKNEIWESAKNNRYVPWFSVCALHNCTGLVVLQEALGNANAKRNGKLCAIMMHGESPTHPAIQVFSLTIAKE